MSALTNWKGSGFKSIYRMSDAQPNWAQTDPSQPDYIKNKHLAGESRPIYLNGEELVGEDGTGAINIVAGENIVFTTDGTTITISATGGGEPSDCNCPDYIEGDGIDIVKNNEGQMVVSIEDGSISDEHIESISVSKIVQDDGDTLILNGGSIDG
jgi:hypothetical protein